MEKKYLWAVGSGLICAIILNTLFYLNFFNSWQLRLSDNLFLPRKPRSEIIIVAIDDKSIQALGRWPWDRRIHARLINKLGKLPKVIGFDVSFPETSDIQADLELALALKDGSKSVLPITSNDLFILDSFIKVSNYLQPIDPLAKVSQLGLVNMFTDPDNITRQTPIKINTADGKVLDNFSAQIIRQFGSANTLQNLPAEKGLMRINFVDKPETFPMFSYIDVLEGKIEIEKFTDKIVLIGATALDLHDTLLTPVSIGVPMSGIEVHANVIQTILDQKYLYFESKPITILTILIISLLSAMIFAYLGIIGGTLVGSGVLIAYTLYAIISFDHGQIRNLIFPLVAVFIMYITQVIYKYLVENKQKRFIKKALSFYLSESVMREVLSNPQKLTLGGSRKDMTVLFSDIAGFTTISEKLPPETLAQLLNKYLTNMTNIVFTKMGVLDKYIGDAVMAFWGAPLEQPEHALLACKAAIRMQEEIKKINSEWQKAGIEGFDVRIGINSGDMIVGNMGSDLRFDYTLLGDNVNLGSRLEGINKEYGTHIIISGSTYEHVKNEIIARQLDIVAVKGKAKGVSIFELRGLGKAIGIEKEFLDAFESARKLYHKGDFKNARIAFTVFSKDHPHDKPTKVYIKRCAEFIDTPPADWDGIFHAKSK